jgi:hypothetical protein
MSVNLGITEEHVFVAVGEQSSGSPRTVTTRLSTAEAPGPQGDKSPVGQRRGCSCLRERFQRPKVTARAECERVGYDHRAAGCRTTSVTVLRNVKFFDVYDGRQSELSGEVRSLPTLRRSLRNVLVSIASIEFVSMTHSRAWAGHSSTNWCAATPVALWTRTRHRPCALLSS